MLRISRLADYATVIMSYLAKEPSGIFSAAEIAKRVHIAFPTTSKILKVLVGAALVISVRGSGGGYQLSRAPQLISLAEIVIALDGYPALTECNKLKQNCLQTSVCAIRDNWRLINKVIIASLQSISLADMTQPLDLHPLIIQGLQISKKGIRNHVK